jgi:predicted transcriptional regulator
MKTQTLNLQISESLVEQLDSITKATGESRSSVIMRAIEAFLDVQAWQIEEIKSALREIEAGDFASPEEVEAMFEELCGEASDPAEAARKR